MKLAAFAEHIKALLPTQEVDLLGGGKGPAPCGSISELCRQVGISRPRLYRWFAKTPWERRGGRWAEHSVFVRLSTLLQEPLEKLLWLAGYNPFAGKLSRHQLNRLYEVMARAVAAIQDPQFDGGIGKLVASVRDEEESAEA